MRASPFAVLAGGLLLAACATTNPYGPSGEERLDAATSDISPDTSVAKANAKHLERIQSHNCADAHAQLAALPKKDKTEASTLADLTGLVTVLRAHKKDMDAVLDRHPGLKFFKGKAADGNTYDIQATMQTCSQDLTQVESKLDSLIRDITRSPIAQQIVGKGRRRHMVPEARVDFDLLAKAIKTLAPVDADVLMSKVSEAKKQLAADKSKATRHHRRYRRRRHRR